MTAQYQKRLKRKLKHLISLQQTPRRMEEDSPAEETPPCHHVHRRGPTSFSPSGLSIGAILNITFPLKARARGDSPVRKSITPWMMNCAGVSPGWTLQ